jgi:gliding motility-associated-like protein
VQRSEILLKQQNVFHYFPFFNKEDVFYTFLDWFLHFKQTRTHENYHIRMKTKLLLITMGFLALCLQAASQTICPLPNRFFAQDTLIICKDTSFRLTVIQYPGAGYLWSSEETDTSILATKSGRYNIRVTDPKCSISDSIFIQFNSFIQSPVTDTSVVCLNSNPNPLAADGVNLKWYDTLAIGGSGSIQAPKPSTNRLGEKTYYVSQTLMGCESPRAPLLVEVIDKPKFDLGENILIPCGASGISLQVIAQNYTSYSWTNGTSGPLYNATEPGTYILKAINMCGSKMDTVIAVDCNTQCVHFPSAFTPNGDGLNDVFRATAFCPVEKFRLVIANRFGEVLFETKNPKDQWDGKWMGKLQVAGTYVFFCQYNDFVLKKDMFFKGSFQLIK